MSTGRTAAPSSAVVGIRWAAIARHLHPELASVEQGTVHCIHRVFGVPVVVETHEGKATAFLGVPVTGDINIAYPTVLFKHTAQSLG